MPPRTPKIALKASYLMLNFHLKSVGSIRQYINTDACKILTHALVTSRLDYSNSLLFGLTHCVISCLQRVQNTAARIVTQTRKRDHITPVLRLLHWLPLQYRLRFKVCLHVYRTMSGRAPNYLCNLLVKYRPARPLRSESQMLLHSAVTCTQYGSRSFAAAAATCWNILPFHIKDAENVTIFKNLLKTFYFNEIYCDE